jgi:hypothetical protein
VSDRHSECEADHFVPYFVVHPHAVFMPLGQASTIVRSSAPHCNAPRRDRDLADEAAKPNTDSNALCRPSSDDTRLRSHTGNEGTARIVRRTVPRFLLFCRDTYPSGGAPFSFDVQVATPETGSSQGSSVSAACAQPGSAPGPAVWMILISVVGSRRWEQILTGDEWAGLSGRVPTPRRLSNRLAGFHDRLPHPRASRRGTHAPRPTPPPHVHRRT